jgi:hypothetical protein
VDSVTITEVVVADKGMVSTLAYTDVMLLIALLHVVPF